MRSVFLTFGLVCGCALPLAACGDDDGGGPLTAGEANDQIVASFCAKAFECKSTFPTNLGFTHQQLFGTDGANCKTLSPTAAQVQASVDAGRVVFDATAGTACAPALDALSCAAFWAQIANGTQPAPCAATFAGTVASGGACTLTIDCVDGACNANHCE